MRYMIETDYESLQNPDVIRCLRAHGVSQHDIDTFQEQDPEDFDRTAGLTRRQDFLDDADPNDEPESEGDPGYYEVGVYFTTSESDWAKVLEAMRASNVPHDLKILRDGILILDTSYRPGGESYSLGSRYQHQ